MSKKRCACESRLRYREAKFEHALSSTAKEDRKNMQGIFYSYIFAFLC